MQPTPAIGFGLPRNLALFEKLRLGFHVEATAFQNTDADVFRSQFASQGNSRSPGPDHTNVGVQYLALIQGVEIQDHSRARPAPRIGATVLLSQEARPEFAHF